MLGYKQPLQLKTVVVDDHRWLWMDRATTDQKGRACLGARLILIRDLMPRDCRDKIADLRRRFLSSPVV